MTRKATSRRLPRGIRNHNPGNIERGDPWQGLARSNELTPEQRAETRFAVFRAPEWGIRAMARVLIAYQDRHGIDTINGIVRRWAPARENDSARYAAALSARLNLPLDRPLDLHRHEVMRPLVEAIILIENGVQPYRSEIIDKGLMLAGIDSPARKLVAVTEQRAARTATGAGAIAAVAAAVQAAGPALPLLDTALRVAPWLAAALLALAAFAFWRLAAKERTRPA